MTDDGARWCVDLGLTELVILSMCARMLGVRIVEVCEIHGLPLLRHVTIEHVPR